MTLKKQQLNELKLIHSCPKALRKHFLKKLPNRTVKTICECTLNLLKGNIPLSPAKKRTLAKYKTTLRKIGTQKGSLFTKKKLIVQHGGFLNILIPAALTVLTSLINGV